MQLWLGFTYRLGRDVPECLRGENYYPSLYKAMLEGLHEVKSRLEKTLPSSVAFISQLVGKLCLYGHAIDLWTSLLANIMVSKVVKWLSILKLGSVAMFNHWYVHVCDARKKGSSVFCYVGLYYNRSVTYVLVATFCVVTRLSFVETMAAIFGTSLLLNYVQVESTPEAGIGSGVLADRSTEWVYCKYSCLLSGIKPGPSAMTVWRFNRCNYI